MFYQIVAYFDFASFHYPGRKITFFVFSESLILKSRKNTGVRVSCLFL
jgi:hypothetical protein